MASTTETRPPHVIDVPTLQRGRRMPEGWLRGIVGGVEAALLSWLTVVVPAVAAYVATAAAPALGDASWQAAAGTGTALWLLAHGGTMTVGAGAAVSVAPLGLTALSLALVHGSTRRMRLESVGAGAFMVIGFLTAMAGFSLLVAVPSGRGPALIGGAVVAVVGTASGLRRSGVPGPGWWSVVRRRLPAGVTDGLHGACWMLAGLAVVATVVVTAGLVMGWDRVLMVQDAYTLDAVSTVVMVLGQVLFLPTAMVWALAWAAGPGFAVGAGTQFVPGEVVTAPLPAIPLLGALPSPDAPGPAWVVVVPVLVGAAVALLLGRRRPQENLSAAVLAVGVASVVTAAVAALLVVLASGSLGPGRMAEVGADAPLVAALLLAEIGGGALVGAVAIHPRTHTMVGARVAALRTGAQGVLERRQEARSAAAAGHEGDGVVPELTDGHDTDQVPSGAVEPATDEAAEVRPGAGGAAEVGSAAGGAAEVGPGAGGAAEVRPGTGGASAVGRAAGGAFAVEPATVGPVPQVPDPGQAAAVASAPEASAPAAVTNNGGKPARPRGTSWVKTRDAGHRELGARDPGTGGAGARGRDTDGTRPEDPPAAGARPRGWTGPSLSDWGTPEDDAGPSDRA
ncbi:cell division protein PerM [Georgenia subflava]|uniref:Uncharacterized protein n=1 Tax=Georgenia subflava TaxID=1622177 RepID=A0A6N7ENX5_9MICO|nr:DUF6350 family protein [Georgenia subflava]MPV38813.1 hypothetical protein [Georgenia subflava]